MTDSDADRLLRDLKHRIAREDRLVTAYSGGADSALLAAVAHQVLGSRALAVTAVPASLAAAERAAARDFALRSGSMNALLPLSVGSRSRAGEAG